MVNPQILLLPLKIHIKQTIDILHCRMRSTGGYYSLCYIHVSRRIVIYNPHFRRSTSIAASAQHILGVAPISDKLAYAYHPTY